MNTGLLIITTFLGGVVVLVWSILDGSIKRWFSRDKGDD